MERRDAECLARELMERHGLEGWRFVWSNGKREVGCCRFGDRQIRLSRYIVDLNGRDIIEDVIRHEIAHALAGRKAGHGPKWVSACLRIGAKPERLLRSDQVILPQGRYRARCRRCGELLSRHRRPPRGGVYLHTGCGGRLGRWFDHGQPA